MRPLSALLLGTLLALGSMDASLTAPTTKPSSKAAQDQNLQTLRALLSTPEARIDLAKAKVTIDRMIDPSIDASATLKQLDALAEKIRARFPSGASNRAKLDILLSSIYQPGPWNDYRPFSYDLSDPFGETIRNKLISTYLVSRKGNCVSMPILFVILGQKLGLKVMLATAPKHLLVKFDDADNRQWFNIEATAGGFKYDSSYERETSISSRRSRTKSTCGLLPNASRLGS